MKEECKIDDSSTDETDKDEDESVVSADNGFLAVRRLTRLLDNGLAAKGLVDLYINNCDLLVNIKAQIGEFRKGHAHHRPEISRRHTAYNRGVSYLHRYCFLIAVAAFVTGDHKEKYMNFQEWMASR